MGDTFYLFTKRLKVQMSYIFPKYVKYEAHVKSIKNIWYVIFMPCVVTKNYTWTELMCTVSPELNDVLIPSIKNIPLRQLDVFSSCWMHFDIFDVLLAVIDLILIFVNLIFLSIRLPKWCLILDSLLMLIDLLLYHYVYSFFPLGL